MNLLEGKRKNIKNSQALDWVDADVDGEILSALIISSNGLPSWMKTGESVTLIIKETEVSIAKGLSGKISLRNRFLCHIEAMRKGELLSEISLKYGLYSIVSVITTRAVESLELKVGEQVEALVKSNEVSLMKIN